MLGRRRTKATGWKRSYQLARRSFKRQSQRFANGTATEASVIRAAERMEFARLMSEARNVSQITAILTEG